MINLYTVLVGAETAVARLFDQVILPAVLQSVTTGDAQGQPDPPVLQSLEG